MAGGMAKKSPMQNSIGGAEIGIWSLPREGAAPLPLSRAPADIAAVIQQGRKEIAENASKVEVAVNPLSASVSLEVLNESLD